jgi:inosose dehydratase
MPTALTRRDFLVTTCAVAAATATFRAAATITVGYAAITWGGNDEQAIQDVSSLGFKGIQLRSSAVDRFAGKPAELEALLRQRHLTMAVLSSGNLRLDPAFEAEDLAKHSKNAQFVRAVGGLHLQVIDEPPKGATLAPENYKRMGRLLTELGKRTADAGIPLVYHNHMNSMSRRPKVRRRSWTRATLATSASCSTSPIISRAAGTPSRRSRSTKTESGSCT